MLKNLNVWLFIKFRIRYYRKRKRGEKSTDFNKNDIIILDELYRI